MSFIPSEKQRAHWIITAEHRQVFFTQGYQHAHKSTIRIDFCTLFCNLTSTKRQMCSIGARLFLFNPRGK